MSNISKKPKDPAYPTLTYDQRTGNPNGHFTGISIRDYFAAKVMQAMITGIDTDEKFQRYRNIAKKKCVSVSDWIATDAYKQADAMMHVRNLNYSKETDLFYEQ